MNEVSEFWHVSYPVESKGGTFYYELIAGDEQQARSMARARSRSYSHATVTNRAGLVATYVNGREWVRS